MLTITSLVDEGLGNSAYLVEVGDGQAVVVDPRRDIRPCVEVAASRGLDVTHALETHLHADFVSGSRAFGRLGARVVAPGAAGLRFPHDDLADGDELDLGRLRLRALGTPGHAPEHLAYLLLDGADPVALFSGGALVPGWAARTDLVALDQAEPLARALYASLHERIAPLPDDLPVYPTHGQGSFCSTGGGGERTTTIGRERALNPLLAPMEEDRFVELLLSSYGRYPRYFRGLRAVNQRGPHVDHGLPALPALDPPAFERGVAAGGACVDLRPIAAFAAGHIPGSLSIELRPGYTSWLGWLVDPDRPLFLVLDPRQDRDDAVGQAYGIGHERYGGELAGGIEAWRASGRPVAAIPFASPGADPSRPLVDVRQPSEFEAGHVPGARSVELGAIAEEGIADLPPRFTVMCEAGMRAMTAASLAEAAGRDVAVFAGSYRDWVQRAATAAARGDAGG